MHSKKHSQLNTDKKHFNKDGNSRPHNNNGPRYQPKSSVSKTPTNPNEWRDQRNRRQALPHYFQKIQNSQEKQYRHNQYKNKKIDIFSLQTSSSAEILKYLKYHFDRREREKRILINRNFGAVWLPEYKLQKRLMESTTEQRVNDLTNKKKYIRQLLLDQTIHISDDICKYIILHTMDQTIGRMLMERCTEEQLRKLLNVTCEFGMDLFFETFIGVCKQKNIDLISIFDFKYAIKTCIESDFNTYLSKLIIYIEFQFNDSGKVLVDPNEIIEMAIDKHKIEPFKILASNTRIDKQRLVQNMIMQSKRTYDNEGYAIDLFEFIFQDNTYMNIPFNISHGIEVVDKGTIKISFVMPLHVMRSMIRIFSLFKENKLLISDITGLILSNLAYLFVSDLRQIADHQVCSENWEWISKRSQDEKTFKNLWNRLFYMRSKNFFETGKFYYNHIMELPIDFTK